MALTFTYSYLPATVPADAVRFWCGDTDSANPQLDDGEIAYALSLQPDVRIAAAICLDAIANKYARLASLSVGEVSKQMGDRSDTYRRRAVDLRNEAGKLAMPFFGGQSIADKVTLASNTDAPRPHFGVGQFDNPLTSQFDNQPPDPSFPVR